MLTGKITGANVVGTPKPGDALKLKAVYDVEATEGEAPWTVSVAAFEGANLIGWDNTTHYSNKLVANSVEFTCSIKMPSTAKDITLQLYAHPDAFQKVENLFIMA